MDNTIRVEVGLTGVARAADNLRQLEAAGERLRASFERQSEAFRKAGESAGGMETGVKGLNTSLATLHEVSRALPDIAKALGLDGLASAASKLEGITGLLGNLSRVATLAGAALSGISVGTGVVGAAGAGVLGPILWGLQEINRVEGDSFETTNAANRKALDRLNVLIRERTETGELRGGQAEDLASQLQSLLKQQRLVETSPSRLFSYPAARSINSDIATMLRDMRAATQAGYATEQAEQEQHAETQARLQLLQLTSERATLEDSLRLTLSDRTNSQAEQEAAAKKFVERMRGIAEQTATAEIGPLETRKAGLLAALARPEAMTDADRKARLKSQLRAIEDQRQLIQARTADDLEQIEAGNDQRLLAIKKGQTAVSQQAEQDRKEKIQKEEADSRDRTAKAQAEAERRRKIEHQQDSNRETGAATQATSDEQDPSLTRLERIGKLQADYNAQLGAMRRSANSYENENKGSSDDLKKAENLEKILTLERKQVEVKQKLAGLERDNTFLGKMAANVKQLRDQWSNLGANMADVFTNTLSGAVTSFSQATASSIVHAKNLGEALGNVGMMIEEQLLTAIIQLPIQWLLSHTLMEGISLGWKAFLSAMRAEDVVEANATEVAKTPTLAANATLASIGSWGVAVAIGLAAIAGILAATGAFAEGGMIRGEGTGTSDSIVARLSNGEHVTRAASVANLGERFMAGINAGVVDLSALNAGATVQGTGSGGRGPGSGSAGVGGRTVQNFHFGFHTDESTTLKHLDTVNGRKFLVNASRQTVREVTGKS